MDHQFVRRVLVVSGLMLGLVACGDDKGTETELPNPASAFCVEQGGTLEIVDEAAGQRGICALPDGTRVDEWEYYRANSPRAGS